jgi:ATP-binding protein involved in chromosome partitioning
MLKDIGDDALRINESYLKGIPMKIAVPTAAGKLCMHFGHCEKFVILTINSALKSITSREEMTPPLHEPGVLPKWLYENGVNIIIAGGIGLQAQQHFKEHGIQVVIGAPPDLPENVVLAWLNGLLVMGENICDH